MIEIITKKFTLRPFKKADANDIARYINDRTIYKNTFKIPYPYKLRDAREFLERTIPEYRKRKPKKIRLAIEINREAAGCVSLEEIQGGHKAEIGYWLARKHWKKGVMTAAVKEIVNYGFEELGLARIYAYVFFYNLGSQKVLRKNGFKKEGFLRKNIIKDGKLLDEYLFAKIK